MSEAHIAAPDTAAGLMNLLVVFIRRSTVMLLSDFWMTSEENSADSSSVLVDSFFGSHGLKIERRLCKLVFLGEMRKWVKLYAEEEYDAT